MPPHNPGSSPGNAELRKQERDPTHAVADAALRGVVPAEDLDDRMARTGARPAAVEVPPAPPQRAPHIGALRTAAVPAARRLAAQGSAGRPAPVLLFVPGGAWVHGSRMLQGYALMAHLAEKGWVCLSIDYRVAPHHRWPHTSPMSRPRSPGPAPMSTISAVTAISSRSPACSAGGHLAALAGLTPNDPEMQGDLPEGSDTTVDAVVGIYGRYDWEDRSTAERARFVDFLERVVVKRKIVRHPDIFRNASPIAQVTRMRRRSW